MFNKPFVIALLVSISLNCLFGYLSYSFYSDKAVAESQLATAVGANKDLKESLDKKETACKIADVIVSEYQTEKQEIVKETDGVLNAIDKLPSEPVQVESKPKGQENAKEQTKDTPVSLDAKLPDDLVRLLSESCSRAKGSACDSP
jgi:hypothetical protein